MVRVMTGGLSLWPVPFQHCLYATPLSAVSTACYWPHRGPLDVFALLAEEWPSANLCLNEAVSGSERAQDLNADGVVLSADMSSVAPWLA